MTAINGGWRKILTDGTIIDGSDKNVDIHLVSWRTSSMDIVSAGVYNFNNVLFQAHISGSGNYWQSDDFMAPLVTNSVVRGIRVIRRIEKQIQPNDKFLYVYSTPCILDCYLESESNSFFLDHKYLEIPLFPTHVNKWLIAEIDLMTNKLKWFFSNEMI